MPGKVARQSHEGHGPSVPEQPVDAPLDLQTLQTAGYGRSGRRVPAGLITELADVFDTAWDELSGISQHRLPVLRFPPFLDLIDSPALLEWPRALFGTQLQLLEVDLLKTPGGQPTATRDWHRDFSFICDKTVLLTLVLFLEDMTEDHGPTLVLPGSHRSEGLPVDFDDTKPLPGEVSVPVDAGEAVVLDSAILHSSGARTLEGPRRAVFLLFGFWWMKPYDQYHPLPHQALIGADDQRLQLLSVKPAQADPYLYIYE